MDPLQPMPTAVHYLQMVPVGSVSSMAASIQSLQPNEKMMMHEQYSQCSDLSQNVSTNSSAPPMMPRPNYSAFQQLIIPNSESGDVGAIFHNLKPKTNPMPVKRKYPMENLSAHLLSTKEVISAKKTVQLEHRPCLNVCSPNLSHGQHQVQSLASVLASHWAVKKKRTTKLQPGPFRSGFQKFPTPKCHPILGHTSPGVNNESNLTVRSKLRESISAALASVTEIENSLGPKESSTRAGVVATEKMEYSQSVEFASSIATAELSVGKPNPNVSNDDSSTKYKQIMNSQLTAIPSNVKDCSLSNTKESVIQEFNAIDMLTDEESHSGNCFVKENLLQGNGLSWVLDFGARSDEKEGHELDKKKFGEVVDEAQEVKKIRSPQTLALQIELELFRLFDGVNKKYKEKGRSLLFNLKDKNNPELRDKVMSGKISPARLCSLTADQLASKELSEWRLAKAEEFENMKILIDSDIDIRRLVKKTHKGEYQVEVEEDDVSVEVFVGSSSVPPIPTETEESKSPPGQISDGGQMVAVNNTNDAEEQELCAITNPSNIRDDLMQVITEDEFKDAEFLPPVVSLDEFMESLHKEPQFENSSGDSDKTAVGMDNASSETPPETKSAELSLASHTGAATKTQHNVYFRDGNLDSGTKPTDIPLKGDVYHPVIVSKDEQIWEGVLQLSNSSKISIGCFFKRGEKASTKDWPRTLEIKGRVRLDAFEKFLHDLHKSRSRATMVMHLILKKNDGKESESLSQAVEAYVSGDRVGFAEPVRGLEAYLCPCHPKIMGRIVKCLGKEQSEALSLADGNEGLIGVIVWRKSHVSPNSSSHHKSLKTHQQELNNSSGGKHSHKQDRNINAKSSNLKPKHPSVPLYSSKVTHVMPKEAAAVEGDVPPGFGPSASQEDDDLPEFNFSSGITQAVFAQKPVVPEAQNRPADHMRKLIQKYGERAGPGVVVMPWEDDDDDDIPEWIPPQSAFHQNSLQLRQTVPEMQHALWMSHQGLQQGQFYGTRSRDSGRGV